MKPQLSAREIQPGDIDQLVRYWMESSPEHLIGMGVDLDKMPKPEFLVNMLTEQINTPLEQKQNFATIWLIDGKAIGHCNINHIAFGEQANMHLHMWHGHNRKKGMGAELVRNSLKIFFDKLQLKRLFCEPYALNPAPNKTLEKIGFKFIKRYTIVPGPINFEQEVNQWLLTKEQFSQLL